MRIGELAGQAGLNPKTIRFYEQIGLLPAPARTSGNYRDYTAEDTRRLRFVKSAQHLGLTLDEIREVLGFAERGEPPCGFVRDRLHAEVTAIDARIRELHVLRAELVDLQAKADRLPPATDGYCPIIHVHQDNCSPSPAPSRRRHERRPRRA